jgi:two-component system sensor histidine kinase/response regulator
MSGAGERRPVVVIDDDYAMRLSCRKILEKLGLEVETHDNGAHGLEAVARLKPALVLVDLKMPGMSGMDVIPRVREIDADIAIVVITGYATIDTAVEAMKSGAYDFLPKPFSPDELRLIVNRALERRSLILRGRQAEMEREVLKRRFVSFVSHQLQSPLSAVHQYLDVLKRLEENGDAAKRREWYDRCLARIEDLQRLIRDWLTLAKLEGGRLAERRERVDLGPQVEAALAGHADEAAAAQVSLESRPPEGELAVSGDPAAVGVLLDNLISNGVKYNKPGGRVAVSLARVDEEIEIAVSDTGVGVPEEARPMLFQEFFRLDPEKSGTGLGLAICRKVASDMGGGISVESAEGGGTTFRVRLPAWREPGPPEA